MAEVISAAAAQCYSGIRRFWPNADAVA